MTRKKRITWPFGAIFAVPLPDGSYALGQVIAPMMTNVVYCALTDYRSPELPASPPPLTADNVISRVALTREQLDFGAWPIVGIANPLVTKPEFANERFARSGYVGARLHDAALAADFLAAFHALVPWDDWHDPKYLDTWLIGPHRKPKVLRFKSDAAAS